MPETANPLFNKDNITPEGVHTLVSSLEQKDTLLLAQKQQLDEKDQEIDRLLTLIHLMRQKRFGRSRDEQ